MTPLSVPSEAAVERLRHLARTELSMRARIAHVLLALAASAMTILVTSLWLTEPALPARTSIAFALLAALGAGWVVFSLWVLRRKRVMLARHRVVGGRLAVGFSSLFGIGCIALAATTPDRNYWPAVVMSGVFWMVAVVVWRRAENAHATLVAKRDALARELNGGAR